MTNRITTLFNIQHPIIQAGMVWCSGWKLASAVSNAGGLGLIGAGSMYPEVLKTHIKNCKAATRRPYGVNIPLLYPDIEQLIDIVIAEKVPVVFTSAGNPATWTYKLKKAGITVVHVISSTKFALKAANSGVDAIVAEGFEAGGHNGRDETTTFCLVPEVAKHVDIPVIAAGGIGSGQQMLAAMALGAEGVQIGSMFAASEESSAHDNYKNAIVNSAEGDTVLTLKQLNPVRLIKNEFYEQVKSAEQKCASRDDLLQLLGRGRAKLGIFEGNLKDGELEVGQISASIKEIKPAATLVDQLMKEFIEAKQNLTTL